MDPRRKKIYIGLIIACFAISAGILGWTFFGNPSGSATPDPLSTPVIDVAAGDPLTGYMAPAVFPSSTTFDTEVLESEDFKQLKDFKAIDVAGQLGRPDPFRSY